MVDRPKLGLLGTLARSRRRRIAASLLFSIAVGLAISFVVPLLFAFKMCEASGCSNGMWVWAALLGALYSYFITLPLAILASAYAFYSFDMKLSVLADFTGMTASGRPISPPDLRPRTPMRKVFRAAGVGWLILLAVWIGWIAEFVYRMNNVCAPGDQIILSDTDAIKLAQMRLFRARYGSHGIPGYVDEKPGYADFSQANCCEVKKTRTATGIIVWEVGLEGKTIGEVKPRHVSALVRLSNCGAVFVEDSYVFADPIR
jgi:hypothetical protein